MGLDDYSTNDYMLDIGEHEGLAIYQIINREHNVMEYQDHLLPRVIDTIAELQQRLDESRSKLSTGAVKAPASTVIEGNFTKGDGSDGLH